MILVYLSIDKAHSAGAVEYTNGISAMRLDSNNQRVSWYESKLSDGKSTDPGVSKNAE